MSKTAEFNLVAFEAPETATLEVMDARGEPLIGEGGQPVLIDLYGPGSEAYAKAQARIDQANTARTFQALRTGKSKDGDENSKRLHAEKLASCTARIHHFPIDPLALYQNPRLGYITNQVARFIEDWANFLPPSAQS
jgi:hypothetical protein